MFKDYKNPQLEEYLNKYISLMTIDDKFKPYIVDILLRRAYQFDLTPEEIQTDVEVILASLKEIKIVKQDELGLSETATAAYYPGEKTIRISERTLNANDQALYQTLTHEVYHALSKDPETMEDRLSGPPNRYTNQYNVSLLETIVEKASFKTVFDTKPDNAYYNNNANGYSDMTFVLDAIEAVYGVNEQALLRNSIQSRYKMAGFLSDSIGENVQDTLEFLDKLEMHFARLHKALYPSAEQENLSSYEKLQEVERSLCDIKKVCEEKMADRVMNIKEDNLDQMDVVSFDFNKLNAIFSERAQYFDTFFRFRYELPTNIRYFMDKDVPLQSETNKTFTKIKQVRAVGKNIQNIEPKLAEKLLRWAKCGCLDDYDEYEVNMNPVHPVLLKDLGINLEEQNDLNPNNIYIKPDEFNQIAKNRSDSERYTAPWDNTIAKSFKKDAIRAKRVENLKRFFGKVKNIFSNKNEKQLYLPPANAMQLEHAKTDFRDSIIVSEKQLEEGRKTIEDANINKVADQKTGDDIEYGE